MQRSLLLLVAFALLLSIAQMVWVQCTYGELYTFTGEAAGDVFGWSVSSAGDVDGDGYDDLMVGAPGYSACTGRAYVYSGKTSGLLYTFTGETIYSF
ncbi:MAG: hypothetical protein AMJ90_09415, partial [candidate division Zixibacteria bacterium SM23_73_2]